VSRHETHPYDVKDRVGVKTANRSVKSRRASSGKSVWSVGPVVCRTCAQVISSGAAKTASGQGREKARAPAPKCGGDRKACEKYRSLRSKANMVLFRRPCQSPGRRPSRIERTVCVSHWLPICAKWLPGRPPLRLRPRRAQTAGRPRARPMDHQIGSVASNTPHDKARETNAGRMCVE
jgi:hypothetical protein